MSQSPQEVRVFFYDPQPLPKDRYWASPRLYYGGACFPPMVFRYDHVDVAEKTIAYAPSRLLNQVN